MELDAGLDAIADVDLAEDRYIVLHDIHIDWVAVNLVSLVGVLHDVVQVQ